MKLITLGRLEQVQRDIAAELQDAPEVLDIGCGTGALAALLARGGARVTAVDISPAMLDVAAHRLREAGLQGQVTLQELGVVELNALPDASFDAVTATLVFSELSSDERAYALTECRRVLRPRGRLLVADEVLPASALGRVATCLLRLPFAALAFLWTQNTTHRVAGLERLIATEGFQITSVRSYLAGTLQLWVAQKVRPSDSAASPDEPTV